MQPVGAGGHMTGGIDHRPGEGDGLAGAVIGVGQRDDDLGVLILAPHAEGLLPTAGGVVVAEQ